MRRAHRRRSSRCRASVSAIKVDGERAYERVRDGEAVELAARPVTVSRFDVLALRRPATTCSTSTSSSSARPGTYVRALARDLGAALGVGGHLTALRRTRVGPFDLDRARTLDELAELDDPVTLPLPDAVRAAMPVRDGRRRRGARAVLRPPLAAAGIDRHLRRARPGRRRRRAARRGRGTARRLVPSLVLRTAPGDCCRSGRAPVGRLSRRAALARSRRRPHRVGQLRRHHRRVRRCAPRPRRRSSAGGRAGRASAACRAC